MSAFGVLPGFYPSTLTGAVSSLAFWGGLYFVFWYAGRYARSIHDARQEGAK